MHANSVFTAILFETYCDQQGTGVMRYFRKKFLILHTNNTELISRAWKNIIYSMKQAFYFLRFINQSTLTLQVISRWAR